MVTVLTQINFMLEKIDHLGIAVADLEQAIAKYQALLGHPPDHRETIPSQRVRVAMFRTGESAIELLAGTEADSPISKFIAKRGEGMHHVCFAVADLNAALAAARAGGFEPIPQENDRGAGGHQIAFLHPRSTGGVLIELVEK